MFKKNNLKLSKKKLPIVSSKKKKVAIKRPPITDENILPENSECGGMMPETDDCFRYVDFGLINIVAK